MNNITRSAIFNDSEAMAKIHVDTWLSTYKKLIPSSYLEKLSYSKSKTKFEYLIKNNINSHIVALAENKIVGFASFGKERTGEYLYKGEIQAIYVLKEFQQQGIGTHLFNEAIKQLKKGGNNIMLWAIETNSYCNFYEKHGGIIIDEKIVSFDSVSLKEIAYAWNSFK